MNAPAAIARHNALRVRRVATSRNPNGRGWQVKLLERDNSKSIFDETGLATQTYWKALHTVTRGTAKGRDRAWHLMRAAWTYGPPAPGAAPAPIA